MGRLIPLDKDGAAEVGLGLDTLRKLCASGVCDVFEVAGRRYLLRDGIGISAGDAADDLGVSVEVLRDLVKSGRVKALGFSAQGLRFDPSELAAFVSGLKALKLTPALREELDPAVEEYRPSALVDDGTPFGPRYSEAVAFQNRSEEAAVAQLEAEFLATLPKAQKVPRDDGVDELDMTTVLSPDEIAMRRQFFHQQRAAAAESAKYRRLHSHNPLG